MATTNKTWMDQARASSAIVLVANSYVGVEPREGEYIVRFNHCACDGGCGRTDALLLRKARNAGDVWYFGVDKRTRRIICSTPRIETILLSGRTELHPATRADTVRRLRTRTVLTQLQLPVTLQECGRQLNLTGKRSCSLGAYAAELFRHMAPAVPLRLCGFTFYGGVQQTEDHDWLAEAAHLGHLVTSVGTCRLPARPSARRPQGVAPPLARVSTVNRRIGTSASATRRNSSAPRAPALQPRFPVRPLGPTRGTPAARSQNNAPRAGECTRQSSPLVDCRGVPRSLPDRGSGRAGVG